MVFFFFSVCLCVHLNLSLFCDERGQITATGDCMPSPWISKPDDGPHSVRVNAECIAWFWELIMCESERNYTKLYEFGVGSTDGKMPDRFSRELMNY